MRATTRAGHLRVSDPPGHAAAETAIERGPANLQDLIRELDDANEVIRY